MHTLSSDTCTIYIVTYSFFGNLPQQFEVHPYMEMDNHGDEHDETSRWLNEFHQKISQLSYTKNWESTHKDMNNKNVSTPLPCMKRLN